MLNALVSWSIAHARIVLAAAALLLVAGGLTLKTAAYDVFPEFVPAQAEVQTEAPGLTAEQVEQLVTRPIEQAVAGAAGATTWYATASRNFPSSVETMTVARPGRSASMIFPASSTRTTAGSELAMLNGFAPTVS